MTGNPGRVVNTQLRITADERQAFEALGLWFERVSALTPDEAQGALTTLAPGDALALIASPLLLAAEFTERATRARKLLAPGVKLVVLDTSDACSSPHLPVLPEVDAFLKNFVYHDLRAYTVPITGPSRISHVLFHDFGYPTGNYEPVIPTDPIHLAKIRPSWTYAVDRSFRKLMLLSRFFAAPWSERSIDVSLRFNADTSLLRASAEQLASVTYYTRHRLEALRAAQRLRDRATLTGAERVPQRTYYMDMMRSRVVLSPFGYGEVCFRDFEAMCCGALLVKPDMSHVSTKPEFYIAGETYVPVRWDFADADEKIAWYLSRPAEASRIANNAHEKLRVYYKERRHISDIAQTFLSLGSPA